MKPWTYLAESSLSVRSLGKQRPMRTLVFVYIMKVAHDQTHLSSKTWARSCVQAAEQDPLVAYPVIDIHESYEFILASSTMAK